MAGMTSSRDMSSNEHETNPKKSAHRQASGSEFHSSWSRIEKTIGQMCKGFVLFIVIMWNAKHMTSRFAAPSMIYAPIRLSRNFPNKQDIYFCILYK